MSEPQKAEPFGGGPFVERSVVVPEPVVAVAVTEPEVVEEAPVVTEAAEPEEVIAPPTTVKRKRK